MTYTRREFLARLGAAAIVPKLADGWGLSEWNKTPFPYVDGLTMLGPPAELAESGLSAFLLDVSAVTRLNTTDGSIKYWRSFEACSKSIADNKATLESGKAGNAFHATKAGAIADAHRAGRTAVFFQIQGGGETVGEELNRLDFLYERGLRVFQITHHNNNPWGGGCIEQKWTGLTKKGHEGVERLNALGIIPDLSHVADPTSSDVLKTSKKPVIVSHGGARALVNNARCTPDEIIRGIADSGGAMGIFMMTFWLTNDPIPTTESYLRQLKHVINVGGIDAVGIANDYPVGGEANARTLNNDNAKAVQGYYAWWDGVAKQHVLGFDKRPTHVIVPELNNPQRAFLIHAALEKARYKPAEIEKIMGGNWVRVLKETLG